MFTLPILRRVRTWLIRIKGVARLEHNPTVDASELWKRTATPETLAKLAGMALKLASVPDCHTTNSIPYADMKHGTSRTAQNVAYNGRLNGVKMETNRVDKVVRQLSKELPPLFSRTEVPKPIPGVIAYRSLCNLSSEGSGPPSIMVGKNVCHAREDFVSWLANRMKPGKSFVDVE